MNCFSKCAFNEANLELFIDDDADAEFAGLQSYIFEISPNSTLILLTLTLPRQICSNISKHGRYTFYKLERGNEGKRNSLRD